jgi:ribosomal protein S27AE
MNAVNAPRPPLPDRLRLCTRCAAGVLHVLWPDLLYCSHCGYRGTEAAWYIAERPSRRGRRSPAASRGGKTR